MKRYSNYIIAAALCGIGTIASVLGQTGEWYWLLVSDANVALWLFVAAILDARR